MRIPGRQFFKTGKLFSRMLRRRPFQCLVQVTNRCNMTCDFCEFWSHGDRQNELQLAEIESLAEDLASTGTFMISIEGGEPLVRKDIVEIVRAFSRYHYTILFTNGWYVTWELAQALFAAGLNEVGVSIDYPDARRHDSRRGVEGAFERACQAVEFLREAAPKGGRNIHVMSVLMQENRDETEELLQLSRMLGVGHYFTLVSGRGVRRGDSVTLPDGPVSDDLLALRQRHHHLRGLRTYYENLDPFLEQKPLESCSAGQTSFNIDHVGQVSACIEKIDEVRGSIRQEAIGSILERMQQEYNDNPCQDCWTLCRGHGQLLGNRADRRNLVDMLTRKNAL